MKRPLENDVDYLENPVIYACGYDNIDSSQMGSRGVSRVGDKRARSGIPAKIVGPLVFNGTNASLERALLAVEPSNMPGVHRMTPQTSSAVRLWAPNLPVNQYLEIDVSDFLQAIDGKCIFIFESRTSESDPGIYGTEKIELLVSNDVVRRYGVFVSRFPPPSGVLAVQSYIPFVQDPVNILGLLCNYDSYLGATAVLVKNSEVKATCMLSRKYEAIENTLSEWYSI